MCKWKSSVPCMMMKVRSRPKLKVDPNIKAQCFSVGKLQIFLSAHFFVEWNFLCTVRYLAYLSPTSKISSH